MVAQGPHVQLQCQLLGLDPTLYAGGEDESSMNSEFNATPTQARTLGTRTVLVLPEGAAFQNFCFFYSEQECSVLSRTSRYERVHPYVHDAANSLVIVCELISPRPPTAWPPQVGARVHAELKTGKHATTNTCARITSSVSWYTGSGSYLDCSSMRTSMQ